MEAPVKFFTIILLCLLAPVPLAAQQLMKDINPNGSGNPGPKTAMGDYFYFTADDGAHGFELWKSDGTPTGTMLVKDINPSGDGLVPDQELEVFDDVLYFMADDGEHGKELWRSDGAADGTYLVEDINPAGDSNPAEFQIIHNSLYFAADDGTHGFEPWKTINGSSAEMIMDINPAGDSDPYGFIGYNDLVLFAATDTLSGTELWRSGGESGAELVKNINEEGDSNPRSFIAYKNEIYFVAEDSFINDFYGGIDEMWKTNGTEDGTVQITDHTDYNPSSMETIDGIETDLLVVDDYIYFWSDFSGWGIIVVLMKSDGTKEGTELFEPCKAYCYLGQYEIYNGVIYYVTNDEFYASIHGFDGATHNFSSFVYGGLTSFNAYFNNNLYYNSNSYEYDDDEGFILVKTDGENHTTTINPDLRNAENFFQFGDSLYFTANNQTYGRELWRLTANSDSPDLVKDINPSAGSNPQDFIILNGVAYFTADNGRDGAELWRYDPWETFYATEVVSFDQGRLRDGGEVSTIRSDPEQTLGAPQENDTYNFVALGFGGQITLKLGADVYDDGTAEPEIILVETSFGRADQMCYADGIRQYPESALVEVSHDGSTWYPLSNSYCRTSFLDISSATDQGLPYARYIRITENSDQSRFPGNADGYDVDGIIISRDEVLAARDRLTDARFSGSAVSGIFDHHFFNRAPNEETQTHIAIYPLPVNGTLNLSIETEKSVISDLKIIDMMGRKAFTERMSIYPGANRLAIDIAAIPAGQYVLQVIVKDRVINKKFVKQ